MKKVFLTLVVVSGLLFGTIKSANACWVDFSVECANGTVHHGSWCMPGFNPDSNTMAALGGLLVQYYCYQVSGQ